MVLGFGLGGALTPPGFFAVLVFVMVWGGAPHPGREKFSLHPRHVCDVPTGDAVGPIGPIGHIGRRLTPLSRTALPVARLPRASVLQGGAHFLSLETYQWEGAKRRAAGAVSGEAAERPMEPGRFAPPLRLCGSSQGFPGAISGGRPSGLGGGGWRRRGRGRGRRRGRRRRRWRRRRRRQGGGLRRCRRWRWWARGRRG